jgi:hypothetical protein
VAWSFVVAVAGGAVGLVLGNLRLPLFVAAASSPAAAGGANIAVSGIAAATAATTTYAPGGSTGGCSAGWRRHRSWAR